MVQKTAFRLFEVEVFEGLKRKPVPDGENIGDTELIEYIESALQDMQGNPMIGKPTSLPHPEDLVKQQPKADDPYLTVLEHSRRGRVIEVGVSTGRYGDRDSLMNPKGVVNDISDSATGRNYRVRLAFPEDKNKFYIVSQVRGRSEAGSTFLNSCHSSGTFKYALSTMAQLTPTANGIVSSRARLSIMNGSIRSRTT